MDATARRTILVELVNNSMEAMKNQCCRKYVGLRAVFLTVAIGLLFVAYGGSSTDDGAGTSAADQEKQSSDVHLDALRVEVNNKVARRREMVDAMHAVLTRAAKGEGQPDATTTSFIQAAGTLRLKETTDDLIDLLDYRDEGVFSRDFSAYTFYPALNALILIGKPGSVSALRRLDSLAAKKADIDDPSVQRKIVMLLRIIHGVEGEDVTEFILADRLTGSGCDVVVFSFADKQLQLMKTARRDGLAEGRKSLGGKAYP